MGGEKGVAVFIVPFLVGSPPRGRGKGSHLSGRVRADGITPAWAGKSSNRKSVEAMARDHPRVGGEKLFDNGTGQGAQGSPPRGRGKAFR